MNSGALPAGMRGNAPTNAGVPVRAGSAGNIVYGAIAFAAAPRALRSRCIV
jgi:hypothetical protein